MFSSILEEKRWNWSRNN